METNGIGSKTALILIGYQNDYFASDGVLHQVIEADAKSVLENTLKLLESLRDSDILIISTPIIFTPDYEELVDPVGILKTIKKAGAFKKDTSGAQTIPEINAFGDRVLEVPGKRGLNAFSNTYLDEILQQNNITDIAIAGVVTSICIDSTGRSAHEKGYKVKILSDCICGRSKTEQNFYLESVFPLYSEVIDHQKLLEQTLITAS